MRFMLQTPPTAHRQKQHESRSSLMKHTISMLVTVNLLLDVRGQANAAVIPSRFSTGVDSSGTALPDGPIGSGSAHNLHYSLVSAATGSTTQTDVDIFRGQWLGRNADAISMWIIPNQVTSSAAAMGATLGDYDYRTTFPWRDSTRRRLPSPETGPLTMMGSIFSSMGSRREAPCNPGAAVHLRSSTVSASQAVS